MNVPAYVSPALVGVFLKLNSLRSASLVGAAACTLLAGCGGGGGGGGSGAATTQPPPPPPVNAPSPPPAVDLTGIWTTTESLQGASEFQRLEGQGIFEVTDSGGSIVGNWRSALALVRVSGAHESVSNRVQTTLVGTDTGIEFSFNYRSYPISCTYTASVTESPVTSLSGTVTCPDQGLEGTWSATRGVPEPTPLPPLASVDAMSFSACALAGDGRTFCWGANALGVLGTGDEAPQLIPVPSVEGFAFSSVSLAAGGGSHACGIDVLGDAYCWGNQEGGRLGDGFDAESWVFVTQPVPVAGGHSFIDIAVGGDHVCAVADDGKAYCWGHNDSGQLGTGDFLDYTVPQPVVGDIEFGSITAHVLITCGLATDGSAHCWGDGSLGSLGNGTTDVVNAPSPVSGGLTFASLELGIWSACGVTLEGAGYCWGVNGSGELGIGAASDIETEPVLVSGGIVWNNISPGIAVTCGVSQAGTGYCWGGNLSGERGDGAFPAADRPAPGPVSGDIVFESIDADWHTCGVSVDGVVYCWGPGDNGAIGDGTLLDRGVPTPVAGT